MKLTLITVGKMKGSPFEVGFLHYQTLLRWPATVIEIATADQATENQKIRDKIPKDAYVIALDERGKQFTSREFAAHIDKVQTGGDSHLVFIIGGADGLEDETKKLCQLQLSFGKMTLPHLMARTVLMEQLYRAHTILNNHPYHRD
jgi:23S rRNA (pseudouridine1915-N3)-methyltransferase